MSSMQEQIIVNRFEQVLGVWVAIHDEDIHFPNHDPERYAIKLCGSTQRVRANDAWTKLPKHLKEAMVAHELGHLELKHYLEPQDNPFYRLGFVISGAVDPRELAADQMAAGMVGRKRYVEALNELACMAAKEPRSVSLELERRAAGLANVN